MWLVGLNDIYNLSKFMEGILRQWQTLYRQKVSCRSGDGCQLLGWWGVSGQ